MLKNIKIYGLYGDPKKNISIQFENKITILVGKNGCGKTTILNIMNSILNNDFTDLFKYKFNNIIITYNETIYYIYRFAEKIIIVNDKSLKLLGLDNDKIFKSEDSYNSIVEQMSLEKRKLISEVLMEENIDRRVIDRRLIDRRLIDRRLIDRRVIDESSVTLYFPTYRITEIDFTEFLWKLEESDFNRNLYKRNRYGDLNRYLYNKNIVVGINNNDIENIIKEKWLQVSNFETMKLNSIISDFFLCFIDTKGDSNGKDILNNVDASKLNEDLKSIFTNTVLGKRGNKKWIANINEYTKTVNSIKEKNNYFNNIPNIDEKEFSEFIKQVNVINSITHSLNKITNVIEIYHNACKDIEKNKDPFKKLQEILTDFLGPKRAIIEEGHLYFKNGKDNLEFEDLSAGEKQLVTLFVYTCLVAQDGSTVMIDETELSLHVTWQRKIISNLLKINDNAQYIIATHSPFVISEHQELIKKVGEVDYE